MSDLASFLSWYLAVLVLGLISWPLGYYFLRRLPSQGWALSKALGLLLVGYIFWLLGSLGFLMNTLGGILLAVGVMAAGSLWAVRKVGLGELRAFLARNFDFVVATEVLFLAAFALWAFVRAHNPEIQFTEKPMEFAFLNGIRRSEAFPPLDPWLSGYAISYYYFGYVIVAMLARLTGVIMGVAFNLGLSLVFALAATGAWSIVYDLIAVHKMKGTEGTKGTAARSSFVSSLGSSILLPSLLGPLFVLLIGNMGGFLEVLYARQVFWHAAPVVSDPAAPAPPLESSFWKWIDEENLDTPPTGEPSWELTRYLWWWRSSRLIRDRDLTPSEGPTGWQLTPPIKFLGMPGKPIDLQPIDEFPMFSFVLGDLHPHVLALPFVLLAVAFAFHLMLRPVGAESLAPSAPSPPFRAWLAPFDRLGPADFAMLAVVLGALAFLNTWDFPIYLLLTAAAYAVARSWQQGWRWETVGEAALLGGGLLVAGILLYLPFYLGFQTQAGGLLPNIVFPTRLPQFYLMFGPALTIVVIFLVWLAARSPLGRQANWTLLPVTALLILGQIFLLALVLTVWVFFVRPELLSYVNDFLAPVSMNDALGVAAMRRLINPWVPVLLLGMLGIVVALLAPRREAPATDDDAPEVDAKSPISNPLIPNPQSPPSSVPPQAGPRAIPALPSPSLAFVLLLTAVAALLTFAPEFVYLKDNFGARMNTIFKFYYQAWLQWGLVAAFACWFLSEQVRSWGRIAFQVVAAGVVCMGLVYPVMAVWTKTEEFGRPATLDGFAYMKTLNSGDYAAIRWLNDNVDGAGTIAEAIGGQYSEYARISASTGLPTVLGWGGHEGQWRGSQFGEQLGSREPDIETLYTSRSWQDAEEILNRYNIRYVYFGSLEASKYGLAGAGKFEDFMTPIYQAEGVTIYERHPGTP